MANEEGDAVTDTSAKSHPWWAAEVVEIEYADAHPEGKPNVFVQWKGTDLCADFWCDCGHQSHYDGYFAYQFSCEACGAIYAMPSTVYPLKLKEASTRVAAPVVFTADEEGT